ncbi:MAG: Ig-like domain repeat protein, partial [Coriobacteriia bacterium]
TFTLRNPGGQYWDGSSWQGTLQTLTTTHSSTTGNTSATWSDSVTLPTWSSATEGTYTVQATATDRAGNTLTGTAITFRLDNTDPITASVTSPVDLSVYSGTTVPSIFQGSAADNSDGAGLLANSTTFTLRNPGGQYWDGSSWQNTLHTLATTHSATAGDTSATWSDSVTLPTWTSATEGTYTVQATAVDKAGNTFTGTAITFRLDRTGPATASVTSPVDEAAYSAAGMPDISGQVADNSSGVGLPADSTTFTLRRPGGDYWTGSDWHPTLATLSAENSATTDGTGVPWTSSATLPDWATTDQGVYTVQATVADKAGNTYTGAAITFNLDRTDPTVATVTSPVDGVAYKAADVPAFSGDVADSIGRAGLYANSATFTLRNPGGDYWNGSDWQPASFELTATNAATIGGVSASWTGSATMPNWGTSVEGTYTVQATATDKAANTFTGTAITFNLDRTGPATASVTSPVDESAYKPADMPTFSGEAADNAGGAGIGADSTKFTLQRPNGDFWNGSGWQLASFDLTATNAATSGGTSATWTSSATMPDWSTSAEGTYTVQATATDKAGNTFTGGAITFNLDKTGPATASVTSPVDESAYKPADMPTFSGEAADNAGGAGI